MIGVDNLVGEHAFYQPSSGALSKMIAESEVIDSLW